MSLKKLLMNAPDGVTPITPNQVFSTSLYTGDGSGVAKTITNNINLASNGGLVWIKARNQSYSHALFDTVRGVGKYLSSELTNTQSTLANTLTSFNSDGFSLGGATVVSGATTNSFASWTFRKASKFLDVVTYTGNGVNNRQISHNLDIEPGLIIVKKYSGADNWPTWHRSMGGASSLAYLNLTDSGSTVTSVFQGVTNSHFQIGLSTAINENGALYVAYLFAHDPSGIIQCGSYTGNGSSTGPIVNLGWVPQYVLIKNISATGDWFIFDTARGIVTGNNDPYLRPNTTGTELSAQILDLTATGFQLKSTSAAVNNLNANYIYMAIKAAS